MTTKALIIGTRKKLTQRVFEFIRAVDRKFPVEKALIFGSTAKGKRKPESDVDLIIISKSFEGLSEIDRIDKLLMFWSYIEELELLAYTPDEFDSLKDRLLLKEILSYALDITPN